MDANEVLGVVEWALALMGLVGLLAIGWFLARHRELEERVRHVERDTNRLAPIAKALEDEALARLTKCAEGAVP
ncbi:MAG: hypothetical protein QOG31_511 [Thermoplasmata archaeon]|jgi:hypothetical protein|nr:hypothetical protein [Thermoplasmata archaeon]